MDPLDRHNVRQAILSCTSCALHTTCTSPVPFRGPSPCDTLILGEAPGEQEDRLRQPFVGPSGQLIRQSLRTNLVDPDTVAWANAVCCYPRRTPTQAEVVACAYNLQEQLRIIHPSYVLILGGIALSAFWGDKVRIGELRGRWWTGDERWYLSTWHPSAVLRSGGLTSPRGAEFAEDVAYFFSFRGVGPEAEYKCVKCGDEATRWRGMDGECTHTRGAHGIPYCQKHYSFVWEGSGRGRTNRRAS